MEKFKDYTLREYLKFLSAKSPVPGGGSAAALTAAIGAGLICMVANYSKGRASSLRDEKKIREILVSIKRIRRRLLDCVDLDAEAYSAVVQSRKSSRRIKDAALEQAIALPMEVCSLCYSAIRLTAFLVENGNPYLVSDIEVATELLFAAFQSARVNIRINQRLMAESQRGR